VFNTLGDCSFYGVEVIGIRVLRLNMILLGVGFLAVGGTLALVGCFSSALLMAISLAAWLGLGALILHFLITASLATIVMTRRAYFLACGCHRPRRRLFT